ncbi:LOW QUALITY PROTEIN: hypothetical protein NC652_025645 [Populus alba x Populus x berolinensis]|nr:LOW QUALITY PROTEIN: hypothetical protein NC652_025645 [Populus alba x Populus x berolinensis]
MGREEGIFFQYKKPDTQGAAHFLDPNNEGTREQPLGLLQPLFTVDNDWGFFSQKLHIKCSSSSQENGQWKITMYPFTVSMDMVQVSNVKIILCFHEEILKMGTSSEILIFRSAVMWLSIFKTIRLLYLMCCRMYKDI